ncbi:hypothetical protein ISN44_As03g030920, partial [Arabidopsis suecica]
HRLIITGNFLHQPVDRLNPPRNLYMCLRLYQLALCHRPPESSKQDEDSNSSYPVPINRINLINPPRRTNALNKPFRRSKELPSLGRRIKHSMNKDPFDDFRNFQLPKIGSVNLNLQKTTKRERKQLKPNK